MSDKGAGLAAGRIERALTITLFLIAAGWPTAALADVSSLLSSFAPPASDPVLPLLLELFPNLGSGGSTTAFANIFSFFSEAVLMLGSIVVSYHLLAGTIQSAHEGQVLGKNYSSLWAPIRIVLAAAALVPSPTTGLTASHAAVGWAAYWGLGLGNALWTETITALTGTNPIPLSYPPIPDASGMVGRFVSAEMCKEYLNARAQSDQAIQAAGTDGVNTPPYPSPAVVVNSIGLHTNPDVVSVAGGSMNLGETTWHMSFDIQPGVLPQQPNGVIGGCGSFDMSISAGSAGAPVFAAQVKALQDMEQYISATVHNAIVTSWQSVSLSSNPSVVSALQAIANTEIPYYTQTVSQASSQVVSSYSTQNDAFYKMATAGGWSMAGAWYIALTHVNGELLSATLNEPTITPPRYDLFTTADFVGLQSAFSQAGQIFKDSVLTNAGSSEAQAAASAGTIAPWYDLGGWIGSVLEAHGRSPVDNFFNPTTGGNRNDPIAGVIATGQRIATIGGMLMGVGAVGNAVSSVVSWVGGSKVGGLFAGIAAGATGGGTGVVGVLGAKLLGFAMPLGVLIWLAGVLIGYLMPLLPAMIYLSGVLGWLMLVVEGLVAAPLWAFAHLRADGEGIAGPGGVKGYEVIVNIFIAPSLMVLGMIVSIGVCNVMLEILNGTLRIAMNSALAGNVSGITSFLVSILIFAGANVLFAKKSFDLIHLIPTNVPVWLGINAHGRVDATQEGRQVIAYGTMAGAQKVAQQALDVATAPTSTVRESPARPNASAPGLQRPTGPHGEGGDRL